MRDKRQRKKWKELQEELCDMKWVRFFSAFAVLTILICIFLLSETWTIAKASPVLMKPRQSGSLYLRSEYSYLDVRQISEWVYDYAPANSRMRQNSSFFLEVIDTAGRRFIVQIPKNYASRNPDILEGLQCADPLTPYRIYGCAKPISNSVIDGIVEVDQNLSSRDEYRAVYGYAILQIQDRPEADIAFPIVAIFLWGGAAAALYRTMTKGFHVSLQWAERCGVTQEVLRDWERANRDYKKRGFYLGEKYMYAKGGGFFFAYREIVHIEPGADKAYSHRADRWQWPSLFVIELTSCRKLRVGTCDKPDTDRILREKVIAFIRGSMKE